MEMLVTKFSKGKYRNEGELFAETISAENVKLMGEMIALQALRTVKKFDMKAADKLYIGLIKDLHHMSEIDYIVSDGYDVAQTAICFLYQFVGHSANEIYGKDRKGKEITIKLACYREVDRFINLLRNRPDRRGTVVESIDFTDYKALPMDPVNCFEHEQTDYTKYDELVGALQVIEERVGYLIDTFCEKFPDKKIFNMTPVRGLSDVSTTTSDYRKNFEKSRKVIAEHAAKYPNTVLLDGHELLSKNYYLTADILHPSAFGHVYMGHCLAAMLKRSSEVRENHEFCKGFLLGYGNGGFSNRRGAARGRQE